ncbi:MAG: hypothetical protein K6G16_11305 [Lachnospiraceae bacterium]|nr:hypothetical protein [Lachnospiraceae bacterium]
MPNQTAGYKIPQNNEFANMIWKNIPESARPGFCDRIRQIQDDSGVKINGRNSPTNAFFMYLLGTKENFTVDDLLHLEERHKDEIPALFEEFLTSYEQLSKAPQALPPKKNVMESAEYMGGIQRKAMDKIMAYQMPDIALDRVLDMKNDDFRRPLAMLGGMCIDTSQDLSLYTRASNTVLNAKTRAAFYQGFGGESSFQQMQERFSCLGQSFDEACKTVDKAKNDVQRADAFYVTKTMWDDYFRGRTIGESAAPSLTGILGFNWIGLQLHMGDSNPEMGAEARNYLLGEQQGDLSWKPSLDGRMQGIFSDQTVSTLNVRQNAAARLDHVDFESFNTDHIDMAAISSKADKGTLTPQENAGLDAIWGNTFGAVFQSNYTPYLVSGKTPYDAIYIDGQSATERFGEKYRTLSGRAWEHAMQAEILAACADEAHHVELAEVTFGPDMKSVTFTGKRTAVRYQPSEYVLPAKNGADLDMIGLGEKFFRDPVGTFKDTQTAQTFRKWYDDLRTATGPDDPEFRTAGKNMYDAFRINGETVNDFYERELAPKFPNAQPVEKNMLKAAAIYAARAVPGYKVTYSAPRRAPETGATGELQFCDPVTVGYDSGFTMVSEAKRKELRELDGLMDKHPYDMTKAERELFCERYDTYAAALPEAEKKRLESRMTLLDELEHPAPRKWDASSLSETKKLRPQVLQRLQEIHDDMDLIVKQVGIVSNGNSKEVFGGDARDFCRMIEFPPSVTTEDAKKAYAREWLTRYLDVPEGRKQCLDEYFDRLDARDHKTYDLRCVCEGKDTSKMQKDGLTASEHDFIEALIHVGSAQTRDKKTLEENHGYLESRYKTERGRDMFRAGTDLTYFGMNRFFSNIMAANGRHGSTYEETAKDIHTQFMPGADTVIDQAFAGHDRRVDALMGRPVSSEISVRLNETYHQADPQERKNWIAALDVALAERQEDRGLEQDKIRLFGRLFDENTGTVAGIKDPTSDSHDKQFGLVDVDRLFVDGEPLAKFVGPDKYGDYEKAEGPAKKRIANALKAEFMAAAMSGKHRTEIAEIHVGPDDSFQVEVVGYRFNSHALDDAEKKRTKSGARRAFDFGATKIETRADRQDKLWKKDPEKDARREKIRARMGERMLLNVAREKKMEALMKRSLQVNAEHLSRDDSELGMESEAKKASRTATAAPKKKTAATETKSVEEPKPETKPAEEPKKKETKEAKPVEDPKKKESKTVEDPKPVEEPKKKDPKKEAKDTTDAVEDPEKGAEKETPKKKGTKRSWQEIDAEIKAETAQETEAKKATRKRRASVSVTRAERRQQDEQMKSAKPLTPQ